MVSLASFRCFGGFGGSGGFVSMASFRCFGFLVHALVCLMLFSLAQKHKRKKNEHVCFCEVIYEMFRSYIELWI